ncbi:MAG: hypothetical protein H7Y18_13425 [Clostridiaceae bacterium]|nr:hypothetical protein [Clostridiaceae bacterium]
MDLLKPELLKTGDKVATISLSWGGAGDKDFLWRYNIGKKRLEEFGLTVIEMPHTLSGNINSSTIWTSKYLHWEEKNKLVGRNTLSNSGYELLQGKGIAKRHLIGGWMEALEMIKGTVIWPSNVISEELKLVNLPILYNMNFGHTAPSITIPYGAIAEIDCSKKTFVFWIQQYVKYV